MKKLIALTVAAFALGLSATSVKADPPIPFCPPICDPGQKDQVN